jgi:hypothetical protein
MTAIGDIITRTREAMGVDTTSVPDATCFDWVIRAIKNVSAMLDAQPALWYVMGPFTHVATGTVDPLTSTIPYPTGFLRLSHKANIQGRNVSKFQTATYDYAPDTPYRRPQVYAPHLQENDVAHNISVKPPIYKRGNNGMSYELTYVKTPDGSEDIPDDIAELLTYGAAMIGLRAINQPARMSVCEDAYNKAVNSIVIRGENQ